MGVWGYGSMGVWKLSMGVWDIGYIESSVIQALTNGKEMENKTC